MKVREFSPLKTGLEFPTGWTRQTLPGRKCCPNNLLGYYRILIISSWYFLYIILCSYRQILSFQSHPIPHPSPPVPLFVNLAEFGAFWCWGTGEGSMYNHLTTDLSIFVFWCVFRAFRVMPAGEKHEMENLSRCTASPTRRSQVPFASLTDLLR